jgi:PKHD-type hydroxylase
VTGPAWIFARGILTRAECERLVRRYERQRWARARVLSESGEEAIDRGARSAAVKVVRRSGWNRAILSRLDAVLTDVNRRLYGFAMATPVGSLQLVRYRRGDHVQWHMDVASGERSRRKLGMVVQLSSGDEYEGGRLELFSGPGKATAPREAGTLIVFPSYVLHRVTPVTRGVRQCLLGWTTGPRFR